MTVAKDFGLALHAARKSAGLTAKQAAKAAGCHEYDVKWLEQGESSVSIRQAERIAGACGMRLGFTLMPIVGGETCKSAT